MQFLLPWYTEIYGYIVGVSLKWINLKDWCFFRKVADKTDLTWWKVEDDHRQLYDEEFLNLCWSSNVIRANKSRRRRWVGTVARIRTTAHTNNISVKTTEYKKAVGRTGRKWKDNFKKALMELECKDLVCIRSGSGDKVSWKRDETKFSTNEGVFLDWLYI